MRGAKTVSRVYSQVLGVCLLVLGVLGWFPPFSSGGRFIGVFGLTPALNLSYLLTGLMGLAAGVLLPDSAVRLYTLSMTVVYGLLAVTGYAQASVLGVLTLNPPDTLLHTAIFVLSLVVTLAAFNEQGFRVRHGQPSAVLSPHAWQQATNPTHSGHTWKRRALDPLAVAMEQLRWKLENDEHTIEAMGRRQQMLERDLAQLRSDLDLLRAWQRPSQAPQPQPPQGERPSWGPRPTAAPRRSEADPWVWPNQ